jgi:hypothetical protein
VRKYASLEVLEAWRQPRPGGVRQGVARIGKTAHRVAFDYEPRPGYLYVRSRMISSRTNDNHDTFPAGEIEKGYHSFLGKPVFVNHHNANHRRARGVIVAVALHRDRNGDGTPDTWVEGLMEVDAVRFPKLAQAILAGRVNRTSMGVDVDWSTCSACGNKATSPAEYCKHLPAMKGKKIRQRNQRTGKVEEKLIHEICAGLSFFENSLLVEDPADPTAYLLGEPDARGMAKAAARTAAAEPDFRDHVANPCTECGKPVSYSAGRERTGRYPWTHRHNADMGHEAVPSDPSDRRRVAEDPTFSAGRCLACGEPVSINLNALDRPGGGFHHADGMKRDHLAVPGDTRAVYDSITAQKAARDQARQVVRDRLHSQFEQLSGHPLPQRPRGDEDRMPPDPFLAARRRRPQGKPVRGHGRDPRFDGVGLKKDRNGFYVHNSTHRSRSDSYPTADDIPDSEIEEIRATGAARKPSREHPWFMNHPVSARHIVHAYEDSTDDERALGDRWYSDAHHVAKLIGKGDAALGAGLLSAYSPRTLWPVNMFNASRAAQGDPPGPGTGALGDHQRKAIRILGGEHHSKVLTAPKTAAFAHLIEHGGDSEEDKRTGSRRVVIDRHAMSVATGKRLTDSDTDKMPISQPQHYEHVSRAYRVAARYLSAKNGREISPHQVQAATWLRQVRKNAEEDSSGAKGAGGKGRVQMGDNSRRRWVEHHHQHHPGGIPEENMHYHGAKDEPAPPPREPWPVGGTHCALCGQPLAHPGNPGGKAVSRSVPMMCQDCAGKVQGHGDDTALPGYMSPAQARDTVQGTGGRSRDWNRYDDRVRSSMSSKLAYGETRMPPQVDTLRMDECPVCGEHNVWSGSRCPVCGFVVPPSVFRDPDTSKAQEVREQLDDTGDVEIPPDGADQGQPDGALPAAQIGSGEDADDQLVHPDQIAPDGVPTVQGGEGGPEGFDGQPPQDDEELAEEEQEEDGEVPPDDEEGEPPLDDDAGPEDLICPACGTTFETDGAAQPGVPCPACGMAALHPIDEDPAGLEAGEDEDGAAPPEGAEDPSAEGEEPEDEEDEEDEDQEMPDRKTASALAQAQARRIAELSAQNDVLSAQLRFLASAAGIDRELAEVGRQVLRRHADILNPASPVPDPPQAPPTETTEQALQPESMDNAGRPGTTPGANSRVPAMQTTTPITPGVEVQTPPATNLIDVTAPVQGTNPSQDGGVPLEQRRIETDVRIDPDPLKAHGPGIGGQGDNGSAFPWVLDARMPDQQQGGAGGSVMSARTGQGTRSAALHGGSYLAAPDEGAASRRTFAAIRLAKMRVQAGLAQGEELSVAERIERDASFSTPMIEHEIATLEQVGRAGMMRAAQPQRPQQRTAARAVPSLASVGASSQYAPAAADDLDASDIFD